MSARGIRYKRLKRPNRRRGCTFRVAGTHWVHLMRSGNAPKPISAADGKTVSHA
jgi:hypothetical protein